MSQLHFILPRLSFKYALTQLWRLPFRAAASLCQENAMTLSLVAKIDRQCRRFCTWARRRPRAVILSIDTLYRYLLLPMSFVACGGFFDGLNSDFFTRRATLMPLSLHSEATLQSAFAFVASVLTQRNDRTATDRRQFHFIRRNACQPNWYAPKAAAIKRLIHHGRFSDWRTHNEIIPYFDDSNWMRISTLLRLSRVFSHIMSIILGFHFHSRQSPIDGFKWPDYPASFHFSSAVRHVDFWISTRLRFPPLPAHMGYRPLLFSSLHSLFIFGLICLLWSNINIRLFSGISSLCLHERFADWTFRRKPLHALLYYTMSTPRLDFSVLITLPRAIGCLGLICMRHFSK